MIKTEKFSCIKALEKLARKEVGIKFIMLSLLICGSFSASASENQNLRLAIKEYRSILKNDVNLNSSLKMAKNSCAGDNSNCINHLIAPTFIAVSERAKYEVEQKFKGISLQTISIDPNEDFMADQVHTLFAGEQIILKDDNISESSALRTYGPGIYFGKPRLGSIVCAGTLKGEVRKYYGIRAGIAAGIGLNFGTYIGKEGVCLETQVQVGVGAFIGLGIYRTKAGRVMFNRSSRSM